MNSQDSVIDPDSLLKLVKPGASRADKRIFEMHREADFNAQRLRERALDPARSQPAVPDAQIVFNHATRKFGVAIKGAPFVCPLPVGYGGPGCELALLEGSALAVIQPDRPALLIDPHTGATRRL